MQPPVNRAIETTANDLAARIMGSSITGLFRLRHLDRRALPLPLRRCDVTHVRYLLLTSVKTGCQREDQLLTRSVGLPVMPMPTASFAISPSTTTFCPALRSLSSPPSSA